MLRSASRRRFLQVASVTGAYSAIGDLRFLSQLTPLRAEDVKTDAKVQLEPEIEPLVRFIEDTPRERLLEEIGANPKWPDLSRNFVRAATRRRTKRPAAARSGFKFHAVLVVNSAHLASLASPD